MSVEKIIETSISLIVEQYPEIMMTVINNDYFITAIKYNKQDYVLIDFEKKFKDTCLDEFNNHSNKLFNEWIKTESCYKKEYNC